MIPDPDHAAVLLIEDDASLRRVFAAELATMGFQVQALATAEQALAALRERPADAVVLDLLLPRSSGMELLPQLLQHDPDLAVVVCTGHGSVELAVQAMRRGAFDFLTKPVGLDVLEQTVRRAADHSRLLRENRRLRRAAAHGLGAVEVLGDSAAARRLDYAIERIAASPQAVLITGESGTGKEIAARRLHALSVRREQPFVVVNCGAVPRQLIESELFGHLKGAFTGADQKRLGLFEAASGGTLFLDEVAELPPELQPALLRAIQFGEIRPVGSDRVNNVDVRVLAATHRDLRALCREGRFRDDLFYRLAVIELRVPALRERAEDIAPLARAFLQREAVRAGRPLELGAAALQRLQAHPWPGNVRELENAIVRLCVLARGPEITAADIDEHALGERPDAGTGAPLPTLQLKELERLAIAAAMARYAGNKRQAAAALGVALKTLYNKLHAADGGPIDDAEVAGEESVGPPIGPS